MKIPLLFGKVAKHKKFNYQPLYYDAQAEERKQRLAELSPQESTSMEGSAAMRIRGSFQTARKRGIDSRKAQGKATLIRFLIILFCSAFMVAYLQWGSLAFFSLLIFVPVYLYLKLRK